MDFRRGPFGPLASGALRDAVPKAARFRDLHFGDKLRAPNCFVEGIRQTIMITVEVLKSFWSRAEGLQQSEHDPPVAVFVHEFVIVTGTVPAASSIDVSAVGQVRLIEMTSLVPAGNI